MTTTVKDLIASFDQNDFAVQPSPETPTTSVSVKQFIKLFDSGAEDGNSNVQKPVHQISNELKPTDIDSNEGPSKAQFEKTSSSQEHEVFPDLLCEDIKPDVNRTELGTRESKNPKCQSVREMISEYENMVSGDSDEAVYSAPVASSKVVHQLVARFEAIGTQQSNRIDNDNNDYDVEHTFQSQTIRQRILDYEKMVSGSSVDLVQCPPIATGSKIVEEMFALFEASERYQLDGKDDCKIDHDTKDIVHDNSAIDGDGCFKKVPGTHTDSPPAVQQNDDDIMMAGMMPCSRNETISDDECEIQPNVDPAPESTPDTSKDLLNLAEQVPDVKVSTESQVGKKKYLTRYLIKLAGTVSRTARKEKTENVHGKAQKKMKDTDVELNQKKSKKRIASFLTSRLVGCFGLQKGEASLKVKTAPLARPNSIQTWNMTIPMPSGNNGENLDNVNIELTIAAALRT